ncbi:MAG: inorganic pyrophosphatase [Bacteroidales bacterium]|nr:inorganic pyrophosphatase [Bacteroidales bacterium]MDD4672608.1 inorganic pyrophosphatase [Bacteroidales bacterium]MDY0348106.1 inorganic pyrophosphatase [Tenuifilaceae bacterium]
MADKISDPIGRLMGLRYKSHPWHGVYIGDNAPETVTSFIEVVSTDTVKYEIDKESGYLMIDRPQKYSNVVPAIYGFVPQTFCGDRVGKICAERSKEKSIKGDGDPIDIVVLTENAIAHGDILVKAKPIGGFRMIDGEEADDKIVAVLYNDMVYSHYNDITDCPDVVVQRLKHYFLTYKDMPGSDRGSRIVEIYNKKDAHEVIKASMDDYSERFDNLGKLLYNNAF